MKINIFKKEKKDPSEQIEQTMERYNPDYTTGLTTEQVENRMRSGLHNEAPQSLTRPVSKIIWGNVFTLFNLLNVVLAIIIISLGHWKNILFIGVAVCNTAIGIFQELRAKKVIDRLSIVARTKITVLRSGASIEIDQQELVLDDILCLSSGDQICADGEVLYSEGLEVDESLLTGESDNIKKLLNSNVMSGSFVTAGNAFIRVDAVGNHGYAAKLATEAKKEKKPNSELMRTLNNIIRVLTVIIIPVGGVLFYAQYQSGVVLPDAVLGASAAILGMIPEGLILLTGVTFAIGAMNLAKHDTLVQSLPCIETLARTDVLCLDKTGTITDGSLKVTEVISMDVLSEDTIQKAISELMKALNDRNPTALALREHFTKPPQWTSISTVPFSSKRKWSGASFLEEGSFLIGAPEFIFPDLSQEYSDKIMGFSAQGYRVLCLAHSKGRLEAGEIPKDAMLAALIVISDNIREEAQSTFRYFAEQGVIIKVISGDNAATVSNIAGRAGLANADKWVDMSQFTEDADFHKIVEENTVFGRVSPYQKRNLIRALKKNGHTVCMTGDGVNDVLALKEADCSVAMVGGSDAARSASDFVLLTSSFDAMIEVLKEGRRVINNIEQVASLYLVKTIYSTLLSLIYTFLPFAFPYTPLQLGPVNTLTVGIPSFFMALRANYERPRGKFAANIIENSVPAAITVIFNILIIQLASISFDLTKLETATMSILLIGTVGFILLSKLMKPLSYPKSFMLISLIIVFLTPFFLFGDFFLLDTLFNRNAFFYLPLIIQSYSMFYFLNGSVFKIKDFFVTIKKKILL